MTNIGLEISLEAGTAYTSKPFCVCVLSALFKVLCVISSFVMFNFVRVLQVSVSVDFPVVFFLALRFSFAFL